MSRNWDPLIPKRQKSGVPTPLPEDLRICFFSFGTSNIYRSLYHPLPQVSRSFQDPEPLGCYSKKKKLQLYWPYRTQICCGGTYALQCPGRYFIFENPKTVTQRVCVLSLVAAGLLTWLTRELMDLWRHMWKFLAELLNIWCNDDSKRCQGWWYLDTTILWQKFYQFSLWWPWLYLQLKQLEI